MVYMARKSSWWRPYALLAREDFDHLHDGATASADECWLGNDLDLIADRVRLWRMKQVARPGEILPPCGIGEQAVVADAVKSVGQAVQECVFHEIWTLSPRQSGQRFHGKRDSRSVAMRGFWLFTPEWC